MLECDKAILISNLEKSIAEKLERIQRLSPTIMSKQGIKWCKSTYRAEIKRMREHIKELKSC
jgi:hypothetical protein